jgi:antitoxin VapB
VIGPSASEAELQHKANKKAGGVVGRYGIPVSVPARSLIYIVVMSDKGIAKIFMHGRSQAVRLPLAFRLPGDRVRVRRVASGILLEPMVTDIDAWFAALDRFADVPFMKGGRQQPPMPATEDLFK